MIRGPPVVAAVVAAETEKFGTDVYLLTSTPLTLNKRLHGAEVLKRGCVRDPLWTSGTGGGPLAATEGAGRV